MSHIYICSGQGSFRPGMGKRLYEENEVFRTAFNAASSRIGEDVTSLCWGSRRVHVKADPFLSHVAIWVCSYAIYRALRERGDRPDVLMGHSLGEIISVGLSGALSLDDASDLISLRGRLFLENMKRCRSDLVAVLGPRDALLQVEQEAEAEGGIYPANYNTPGQMVFASSIDRVPRLGELARSAGARAIALKVGNGCHSPYVEGIDGPLRAKISSLVFRSPEVPVYSCSAMEWVTKETRLKELLTHHLLMPVHWHESLTSLRRIRGPVEFVDLSFSTVLKGLVMGWDRHATIVSAETLLTESNRDHSS